MGISYNQNLTQVLAIPGGIVPVAQVAGSVSTDTFSLARHRRVRFTVQVGTPGAGGTVDFKVQASATQSGTYTDVVGAAIVQMTAAGFAELEVRAETVNAAGQGPWLKGVLTVAVATTPIAVLVDASVDRYEAASDLNKSTVAAPVVV